MCGIVAILQRDGGPADRSLVTAMVRSLAHRGPDEETVYLDGPVALGFRRLAILDLTATGRQPMTTADQPAVLVFNGEIFNYVELRTELMARGHQFRSTGDAEVLLRSYLEWGTQCVERFNGEWAFVIYDPRRRILFGSRDRLAIKPLYRLETPAATYWASELKALVRCPGYTPAIDWETAAPYLFSGDLGRGERTFFAGIEPVPAATAFEVQLDSGAERRWQYWSVPARPDEMVPANSAELFAETFEDAVRIRLRSDVPVGVCLSGGLDSTAIICAMARGQTGGTPGDLRAFSYHHPDFDERRYVDATLAQTGASLHRMERGHRELWSIAEEVVQAHDEPVHSLTAMVGFELMREIASQGLRVILNGQGADEVLGGYDSFFPDAWYSLAHRGRIGKAWRSIQAFGSSHGQAPMGLAIRTIRRLVQGELRHARPYRSLALARLRREALQRSWFTESIIPGRDSAETLPALDIDTTLKLATTVSPLPFYLRVEDRNAMAHSVEVRLPFLDYRLVDLAFRLPFDWKIRGQWNKFVLREAMSDRIPEVVRQRVDKMGFPSPGARLLSDDVFPQLFNLATGKAARERGVYNMPNMIRELRWARARPNSESTNQLFRVAMFETWAQQFGL